MRLPRRVPWASLAELEQVCSSIYTDSSDIEAQNFAINRISAWRAITTLPHAVDSTLALLVVIVQDSNKESPQSTLLLRQSYSSALIRLVNGLVDPLQVGTYARSINSIAQQLGLPSWLVELRHAATHEELPSIDLLREAARQSMSWLLHNYYLPMLNPPIVTSQETEQDIQIRPLLPLLKAYKGTMKTMTRDVSLVPQHRTKLLAVLRDLERWISECRVASNVANGFTELDWADSEDDEGAKGTWALEKFCDGLLEKGMLVPLARKKRVVTEDFLPSKSSISFWEVLLRHVQSLHPTFPAVLCRHLISTLLSSETSDSEDYPDSTKLDASYHSYLASWVVWTVETWEDSTSPALDLRKDVISELMKALFALSSATVSNSRSTPLTLLKALTARQEQGYETLTTLLLRPPSQYPSSSWSSDNLEIMLRRYEALQKAIQTEIHGPPPQSGQGMVYSDTKAVDSSELPLSNPTSTGMDTGMPEATSQEQECTKSYLDAPGWHLLGSGDDVESWKPCPIGVFYRP